MHRRFPLAASGAAVLSLFLLLSGLQSASAGRQRLDIRFLGFKMTPVDLPQGGFGEPSIALSAKDHVFICGPTGFPGGINGYVRTADWKTIEPQQINDPAGGGDCDIKVGPDGAVYTANLQVVGSAIRKSTDDGKTFGMATEDPVEQDRQWLAPDPKDPNIVYFAYHDFATEAEIVSKSTDGGKTFTVHSVASTDPDLGPDTYPNTFSGPLRVDPTNTNRLFLVYGISSLDSNTNTCLTSPLDCPFGAPEAIVVATSTDGGVTWTDKKIMDGGSGSYLGTLPWISVDSSGNIYAVAAGYTNLGGVKKNGLFMAYSTDHGQTWSKTIKVNKGTGATAFPTVAAGMNGVVDFAWIETAGSDGGSAAWKVHFAQSRNAHAGTPKFKEVTGPLVHSGTLARSLLDFMDMAIDSFGYAHAVVGTTALGGLHVLWWRQDAGPSATSNPCKPRCVTKRPGPRP